MGKKKENSVRSFSSYRNDVNHKLAVCPRLHLLGIVGDVVIHHDDNVVVWHVVLVEDLVGMANIGLKTKPKQTKSLHINAALKMTAMRHLLPFRLSKAAWQGQN